MKSLIAVCFFVLFITLYMPQASKAVDAPPATPSKPALTDDQNQILNQFLGKEGASALDNKKKNTKLKNNEADNKQNNSSNNNSNADDKNSNAGQNTSASSTKGALIGKEWMIVLAILYILILTAGLLALILSNIALVKWIRKN